MAYSTTTAKTIIDSLNFLICIYINSYGYFKENIETSMNNLDLKLECPIDCSDKAMEFYNMLTFFSLQFIQDFEIAFFFTFTLIILKFDL